MISFRPGDPTSRAPGTWWREYAEHAIWLTIGCPDCKLPLRIAKHDVKDDGLVTPSVVCTHKVRTENGGRRQCGFHKTVRLLGWSE